MATEHFPFTSRYHDLAIGEWTSPDGKTLKYVRRRFIPQPERFDLLVEHGVREGDRIDNIAAEYLGDPEQYWRICDANGAMRPEELTESIGSRIRITLPEGIPGSGSA
jgi:hypothetical protein